MLGYNLFLTVMIDNAGMLARADQKGFKIVHLNVCSLRHKLSELEIICSNGQYDVITISESWLNASNETALIALTRYDVFRHDRMQKEGRKKGGGLVTYVKSSYKVDATKYSSLNKSDSDIEMQAVSVKKGQDKTILVVNIYCPPNGNISSFVEEIDNLMDHISGTRYVDIILLGDLNLDHSKGKMNAPTKRLQHILNTHSLYQIINNPTRQTGTSKSIIDVIYIKTSKKVLPFIIKTHISDHYLVGCVQIPKYSLEDDRTGIILSIKLLNFIKQ